MYVDNDRSASNGQARPEWERLLVDVQAGNVDAVVVWNQDRGWRKMSELETLRPIFEPRGVLLATTNIGTIDFGNADDVFRAQVSTALSEMEIAKMKVRMRRAARQRAEDGVPKWRSAFGYVDDVHQPDPVTAPLVREAYAAILAGGSITDVAKDWNERGHTGLTGKPWSPSTVSLFLRAPRNAGLRAHNNKIVGDGAWPGLVDQKTWESAQRVLNAPGRAPGRKSVKKHLLTGVLLCGKPGCNGYLNGQWAMQAGNRAAPRAHSIVYACKTCRGCSVRADHVEPLLYGVVSRRLAEPDAVDLLKSAQHDEVEAERLRAEKQQLYAQIRAAEAEYDDGIIDGRRLKARKERVAEKLTEIERHEQDDERLRVFDGLPLGKPEVTEKIAGLSPDRFRAVVSVLLTATVLPVGKGGKVFQPERVVIDWK